MTKLLWRRWLVAWCVLMLPFGAMAQTVVNDPRYISPTIAPHVLPYSTEKPLHLQNNQLIASSAILINRHTGEVIYSKNPDEIIYPASTTKIMTTWLGVLLADLDAVCYYSTQADQLPSDSSMIGLKVGESIRMRDLLYATMMRSGNDGANLIAETVSGDLASFTELMNLVAKKLKCTGTHFANAHGYHDDDHYSTVRDIAKIAYAAMENETFRNIADTLTYDLPASNMTGARELRTTAEPFLNPNSTYYYPYASGMKTGYHARAGYCFVGTAEKDDMALLSVVFYTSEAGRWTDTTKLMDYGFAWLSLFARSEK